MTSASRKNKWILFEQFWACIRRTRWLGPVWQWIVSPQCKDGVIEFDTTRWGVEARLTVWTSLTRLVLIVFEFRVNPNIALNEFMVTAIITRSFSAENVVGPLNVIVPWEALWVQTLVISLLPLLLPWAVICARPAKPVNVIGALQPKDPNSQKDSSRKKLIKGLRILLMHGITR